MAVMRTAFNESQDAYLAALALDAAALLAYTTLRKKRFALRGGMHQTFLPLMAMVLLAATSISASVGSGSGLVSFLTYALYALAAILTLATLCAIANAGEFSADLVFSTAVLLFCAASFAGQSFARGLVGNGGGGHVVHGVCEAVPRGAALIGQCEQIVERRASLCMRRAVFSGEGHVLQTPQKLIGTHSNGVESVHGLEQVFGGLEHLHAQVDVQDGCLTFFISVKVDCLSVFGLQGCCPHGKTGMAKTASVSAST